MHRVWKNQREWEEIRLPGNSSGVRDSVNLLARLAQLARHPHCWRHAPQSVPHAIHSTRESEGLVLFDKRNRATDAVVLGLQRISSLFPPGRNKQYKHGVFLFHHHAFSETNLCGACSHEDTTYVFDVRALVPNFGEPTAHLQDWPVI